GKCDQPPAFGISDAVQRDQTVEVLDGNADLGILDAAELGRRPTQCRADLSDGSTRVPTDPPQLGTELRTPRGLRRRDHHAHRTAMCYGARNSLFSCRPLATGRATCLNESKTTTSMDPDRSVREAPWSSTPTFR